MNVCTTEEGKTVEKRICKGGSQVKTKWEAERKDGKLIFGSFTVNLTFIHASQTRDPLTVKHRTQYEIKRTMR